MAQSDTDPASLDVRALARRLKLDEMEPLFSSLKPLPDPEGERLKYGERSLLCSLKPRHDPAEVSTLKRPDLLFRLRRG